MGKEEERERKLSIIHDVYEELNKTLAGKMPSKETRDFVKESLLNKLTFLDNVICDESNNPPSVMDDEVIIVRCEWNSDIESPHEFSYINLAFGNPERTYTYLLTFR